MYSSQMDVPDATLDLQKKHKTQVTVISGKAEQSLWYFFSNLLSAVHLTFNVQRSY